MYYDAETAQVIYIEWNRSFERATNLHKPFKSTEVNACLYRNFQQHHRPLPPTNHNPPTNTKMGETTINGSCLCKGIHFTVTGQDKGAVLCHCNNCKSFTGSAYAHNHRMMKTKIEYQKGQDLVRSYKDGATKSGKVLERFFCSRCVC